MSVSPRSTDEATSAVANSERMGPPVSDPLEETRDGGFDELPAPSVDAAKSMPYLAGDVIANKYRLTKILGEGGMGAVWLARNLALEIDVAIKLIRHDYANSEAAPRLLQEARAAARIGHPSIVRVFDFGTTERADPFIVMEVLQGESLAETISRKGKLSAVSAVRTLLPVASALAAAHSKGIVHRDLKPDNIRLVTDDRGAVIPKIVDFGIAKLHHDDVPRETTQAGVILGSPHYMSPEQACGRSDVDHRTDIWAFSVMLYEVTTGVRPFEGPNYNALISSILVFRPAPWMQHEVDEPELWALIEKGLAKEPTDRWQSMQEFGEALAIWASEREVETDAAGNSLRAHWLAASMHRPLSEFPPSGATGSEGMRPRMNSEREIRIPRAPSIPEIVLPNSAPAADPPSAATAQRSQPSNLPLATSVSDLPAEKRRAPSWLGPAALALGAMVVGAIIVVAMDRKGPAVASPSDPKPDQVATSERLDKPEATTVTALPPAVTNAPSPVERAAPASSAAAPESSAAPSASVATSPPATSRGTTSVVTTNKPPVNPKPRGSAGMFTDPNF